jgi:hypothetical protein
MKFKDINHLKVRNKRVYKILQQWKNKTEFKGMSRYNIRLIIIKVIINLSKILGAV